MADLADRGRQVIAHNTYLVLGTVDPSGRPRVSPVWFSMVDHRDVYWLSSADAHHSQNIVERPDISMVVFDSSAAVGDGRAVYLEATAGAVPEHELDAACTAAFRDVEDDLTFTPERLRDTGLVLYRAVVTASDVHVRGRDPEHGTGIDRRVAVEL